jgi:hypothetical protein
MDTAAEERLGVEGNEKISKLREGAFWVAEHPVLGNFSFLAQPSRLSKTPSQLCR